MGVPQIWNVVKEHILYTHIPPEDRKTMVAGIDAWCWFYDIANEHKETLSAIEKRVVVDNFIKKVECLLSAGVQAMVVFDGAPLRSWRNYENAAKTRNQGSSKLYTGKKTADIAYDIIQELKKLGDNVKYVVAPYEADAQLMYLINNDMINVVISRDSDFIAHGCPRVLYFLDLKTWMCKDFHLEKVKKSVFKGLSDHQIMELCLLLGCDYVSGVLPSDCFKDAVRIMRRYRDFTHVIERLNLNVSKGYEQSFRNALHIFKHQKVYNMTGMPRFGDIFGELVYLNDIDTEMSEQYLWFLGESLERPRLAQIVSGNIYPNHPYDTVTGGKE